MCTPVLVSWFRLEMARKCHRVILFDLTVILQHIHPCIDYTSKSTLYLFVTMCINYFFHVLDSLSYTARLFCLFV
jgi:hypothetical protein